MTLNEIEKTGILELLQLLDTEDLISLCRTVTSGFISPKNREDAFKTVILHTQNAKKLLERKKITTQILFNYLNKHEISCNSMISKSGLINEILSYWNSSDFSYNESMDIKNNMETSVGTPSVVDMDLDAFGLQFVHWFYSLWLNSCGLYLPQFPENHEVFDTMHFWPDCTMRIEINSFNGNLNNLITVEGAVEVLSHLKKLLCYKNFLINPNCSKQGIHVNLNSHGLIELLSCGTLLANGTCQGIFEQLFRLLQDPFVKNNWKIRDIILKFKTKDNENFLKNY